MIDYIKQYCEEVLRPVRVEWDYSNAGQEADRVAKDILKIIETGNYVEPREQFQRRTIAKVFRGLHRKVIK